VILLVELTRIERTRDLLNAIQAGGVDSRLAQQSAHRLLFV